MSEIGQLLEPYLPGLHRYAQTMTRDADRADDLVQSCVVRALAHQHLWREGSDLRAWLFTILHNEFIDETRRRTREGNRLPLVAIEPAVLPCADPEIAQQLFECRAAISKLPSCEKQIVLLAAVEGVAYYRLAAILGIPVGTVGSRLARARARLRKLTDGEALLN